MYNSEKQNSEKKTCEFIADETIYLDRYMSEFKDERAKRLQQLAELQVKVAELNEQEKSLLFTSADGIAVPIDVCLEGLLTCCLKNLCWKL